MNDIERIKEMAYQAVFAILDDEEGITGSEAGAMATACESIVGAFLSGSMTANTLFMRAKLESLGDIPLILGTE